MTSPQRNLVIMFADVSGSAALFARLGEREAIHAIERCQKRMRRSISAYRGRIVQLAGDELLALFESTEEASNSAIDMQHRIADLPPNSGLRLMVRIALHYGPVEENDENLPDGEAIKIAARIAGIARRDQILCSAQFKNALPTSLAGGLLPMPLLNAIRKDGEEIALSQIEWFHYQPGPGALSSSQVIQNPITDGNRRLCLRFRGKTFLLDEKTPVFHVGRDLGNQLVIEDRKASRQHARLERRSGGLFYLVDNSTNGSFVALAGRQEVMVRREEILLEGQGRIGFGSTSHDPSGSIADFEAS